MKESHEGGAVRTAAVIRVELTLAEEADAGLAVRAADAQRDLQDARNRFDTAMQALATDPGAAEPSRGEIEGLTAQCDALNRISRERLKITDALRREFAAATLAEAIAAGRDRLPVLTHKAEVMLAEFGSAIEAARKAEAALFAVLFDQTDGLRQSFASAELSGEAARTRRRLADSARSLAGRSRYPVNPRFETDGEVNLGAEIDHGHSAAWARRQTPDAPKADPFNIGELVPEAQVNHEAQQIRVW